MKKNFCYFKKKLCLCFIILLFSFYFSYSFFIISDINNDYLAASNISITLNKKTLNMKQGGEEKLTYKISSGDSSSKIIWASSNKNVVSVDNNGNVKAVGVGSAYVIIVLRNNYTVRDVCKVTVTANNNSNNSSNSDSIIKKNTVVNVSSVSLSKTSMTVAKGQSGKLNVIITPPNATNKKLNWTSSNSNVVSVDSAGNIKAVSVGSATITVTSESNSSAKSSCVVTVKDTSKSDNSESQKKATDNKLRKLGTYRSAGSLVTVNGDGMHSVHVSQGFCVVHKNDDIYLVAGMRNKGDSRASVQIYKRVVEGGKVSFKRKNKFYKSGELGHNNGMTYNPKNGMIYVAPSGAGVKIFDFDQSLKKNPSLKKVNFKDSTGKTVAVGAISYDSANNTFYTGSGSKLRMHNSNRSGIIQRKKKKYVNAQDIGFYNGKVLVVRYNSGVSDSKSTVSRPRNAVDVYEAGTLRYIGTNIIKLGSNAELESVDYYGGGYFAAYYYMLRSGKGRIVKIKLNLG